MSGILVAVLCCGVAAVALTVGFAIGYACGREEGIDEGLEIAARRARKARAA